MTVKMSLSPQLPSESEPCAVWGSSIGEEARYDLLAARGSGASRYRGALLPSTTAEEGGVGSEAGREEQRKGVGWSLPGTQGRMWGDVQAPLPSRLRAKTWKERGEEACWYVVRLFLSWDGGPGVVAGGAAARAAQIAIVFAWKIPYARRRSHFTPRAEVPPRGDFNCDLRGGNIWFVDLDGFKDEDFLFLSAKSVLRADEWSVAFPRPKG